MSNVNECYDEAMRNMKSYLERHNYGMGDYDTYYQDPEWQKLNEELRTATKAYKDKQCGIR